MNIDDRLRSQRQASSPLPQIDVLTSAVPHLDLTSYGVRSGAGT
jgi:hypothetical protein